MLNQNHIICQGAVLNPTEFDQFHEMFVRLAVATLMGGVLGIDRDLHHKPAGVRVLSMVCMGAAAITMVSVIAATSGDKPPTDGVLRTIQGVLSGIGFLGAGVIMRAQGKDEVHGITTAASIWVAAILGMICGLGQWQLAVCAFVLTGLILVIGRWVEAQVLRLAPQPKYPLAEPVDPRK